MNATTTLPPTDAATADFVISRMFDAPRDLVYRVWTETQHLKHWWGPKGFTSPVCNLDLRPGGSMHYCLRSADGHEMWGKFVYREVTAPLRLVFVDSFSNAAGDITRHPLSPTWPLEMLSTITFEAQGAQTKVTVRWGPLPSATAEERKAFDEGRASMNQGWTGTLDQLEAYLSEAKKK